MPFNLHDIIGVIAPRLFFSNSPVDDDIFDFAGVLPGIELAREAYRFIDHHLNHVPGRHEIE